MSKKTTKHRDKWYDKPLHKLKTKANKLHKVFLSDQTDINKHAYNRANNHFFYELSKKTGFILRKSFYQI